ncbi:LEC14B protein isoform X3 [Nymphaea colorata]|uniref:LEC14B protein isoform X3 n=1 Tax=Nymphaea colorata TaxID=210225 RepID=UPI00129D68C1|nr:LEC14B protein isoform X3 [Nymphaea colorata]
MDLSSIAETYIFMGHGMSQPEEEEDEEEEGAGAPQTWSTDATVSSDGSPPDDLRPSPLVGQDISHLTKLRTAPSEMCLSLCPRARRGTYVSTTNMLTGREANVSGRGRFSSSERSHVLSRYLPSTRPWSIDKMSSKAYVSQFSADGTLFVAGFQDRHIRIYSVDNGWRVQKDIHARNLRWTVTDTSLSPDQRFLVYSTMSPIVHIVNAGSGHAGEESVANVTEIHEGLHFSNNEYDGHGFGIFCVKFSTDGRELVAGSSDDSIYVFDLEANKLSLAISAHTEDVNTVSFADESGHIMYSGSDDSFCKVWDRRCFIRGRAAGVLVGHLEGITFLDSRGDGRYFISNGKDQSIKLWDIRKMSSNTSAYPRRMRYTEWDYRWMDYPTYCRKLKHPNDQSLATYKGHQVLRTLIRCYFSPVSRLQGILLVNWCITHQLSGIAVGILSFLC